MLQPRLHRLRSLAVIIGLILLVGKAPAQYTWTATASGNWSTMGNWMGGSVPMSGTTTTITFGAGTYTATDDLATTPFTVNALTFGASGTATVSVSASQTFTFDGTTPAITMGAGNAVINPALTLNTSLTVGGGAGTLTLNGAISGGTNSLTTASTGTVNITGGGTINQLFVNGGTTNITGGTLAITQQDSGAREASIGIGEAAGQTATLNVNGGAVINYGHNIYIGDVAGTTGTMVVSGPGTVLNITGPPGPSTARLGRLAVGNFGNGTLNILNGAVVNTNLLFTPREPGTNTGTILVDGPGSTLNCAYEGSFCSNGIGTATFSHGGQFGGGGDLLLGVNAAGNGVVTFTDPGTRGDASYVGIAYGASSANCILNVKNGAVLTTPNLTIGQAGTGVLNLSSGGSARSSQLFFMGDATGSMGTLNMTGFGTSLIIASQSVIAGDFDNTGAPIALGTGVINADDGTVVSLGLTNLFAGGTFNVNTGLYGSFTVGGITDGIPGMSVGSVVVGAGSTFAISTTGNSATFSGVISGAGGVTKTGPGTQYLTGTNTYTGGTTISGGILNFVASANLGPASVTSGTTTTPTTITFDGGTLQWGTGNTYDISARTVTINGGGATIDTGGNNVTFANTIGNANPQNDASAFYPPLQGFGDGALTKVGAGTLTLAPATLTVTNWPAATPGFNNYVGGTNVLGGTLSVASDLFLGAVNTGTVAAPVLTPRGNVTGAAGATLLFTGTTTTGRNYTMNGGTIAITAANTLTFSGGTVTGAILDGAGAIATDATNGGKFVSVTAMPSVTINSKSGKDSFSQFDNGGTLNVAASIPTANPVTFSDFTNEGSGSVTIGASTFVNSSNFQTYGTLTIAPGTGAAPTQVTNNGTSQFFFDGGSRTFISIPAHAGMFDAGIDLHGQNAIVAGGLFVNNGYVVDGSMVGKATVIADFGSLVKGAGFYQNSVQTVNGGKFQSGNSPGTSSFGTFTFGTGGVTNYQWQINDPGPSPTFSNAPGIAGGTSSVTGSPDFGWSLIKAIKVGPSPGNFTWTATAASPLTVILQTLTGQTTVGNDVLGPMQNFDPNHSYSWQFVTWAGTYTGPTDPTTLNSETIFDQSSGPFANTIPAQAKFGWSVKFNSGTSGPGELDLNYTVVPEPGTLALTGLVGLGLGWAARRRKAKAAV
jgi:autotransporter-associated beta strand protein/T5SS/PEP-CTERM-associated repeat protein